MPRFSANISLMFCELEFLDRFVAARNAGFEAVEIQFPYEFSIESVERAIRDSALCVSVINLPPGDLKSGDRGFAAVPGQQTAFRRSIDTALPYARATGVKRMHVMAGNSARTDESAAVFVDNIRHAAERFLDAGIDVLIEPLNPIDEPDYFLSSTDQALDLIARINRPNVRLQFDVYHHQITRGDVIRYLERCLPSIGHIQIANVPDRHEPQFGELNFAEIFRHIDHLGYNGWVGCEYRPRAGTIEGLTWMQDLN